GAGITGHVDGNLVAAAVFPVGEVAAALQNRRNREGRNVRTTRLVKCLPVKVEERVMFGSPMIEVRELDRATEVRAKIMLVVQGTAIATRRTAARIPGCRVEHPIAGIFERRSVVLIAARLADHGDLSRAG